MGKKRKQSQKRVYILVDPRDCRIRYVGCTSLAIEKRILYHMNEARYADHDTPKCRWLRELIECGQKPIGVVVEDSWRAGLEQEKMWIRLLATGGADLTNIIPHDKGIMWEDIKYYKQLNAEMHLLKWYRIQKDGEWIRDELPFKPRQTKRTTQL